MPCRRSALLFAMVLPRLTRRSRLFPRLSRRRTCASIRRRAREHEIVCVTIKKDCPRKPRITRKTEEESPHEAGERFITVELDRSVFEVPSSSLHFVPFVNFVGDSNCRDWPRRPFQAVGGALVWRTLRGERATHGIWSDCADRAMIDNYL